MNAWRVCVPLIACIPGLALSAPPGLREPDPPVVQRGVESQVRVFGTGMGKDTSLVLPFSAEVRGSGGSSEAGSFILRPAADTPVGVYPVRIRTPEGISNLRLLSVTDLPVVRAREPNGRYRAGKLDLKQTQPISLPCIVTGGRLSNDIDAYRFAVKAGERHAFVSETWRMGLTPDPLLWLRDGRGRTLTHAHDTPTLQRDERIDHAFEEDGEGILEIRSTGGGGWNNHYAVKLGAFDYARAVYPLGGRRGQKRTFTIFNRDGKASTLTAEVPGDPWSDSWRLPLPGLPASLPWPLAAGDLPEIEEQTSDGPQKIDWPVTVNGRIGQNEEVDRYRIAVEPGQIVRVRVDAYHLGSALDGYLMVYDPVGKKLLARHDDQIYRGLPDPCLDFEVPKGIREVVISLGDTLGKGGLEYGYRLSVERGGPDFFLWLGRKQLPTNKEDDGWHRLDRSDTLNLVPSKEARLRLSVRRSAKLDDPYYNGPVQGYTGPIRIEARNVPPGVTVKPLTIPEGQTEAELVVVGSDMAPKAPFDIVIVGEGVRADGSTIRRLAERRLYLSDPQCPHLPWNWRVQKVTCVTAVDSSSQEVKR